MLFEAQRPVILNGIEELTTRGDLLDRAIILDLSIIPKDKRRPEEPFWQEFEQARLRILGALLDAVSVALSKVASITLNELPRLADFAVWVTAAESQLGLQSDAFMQAYNRNRNAAHELALGASLIVPPLRSLVEGGAWLGTATELLKKLVEKVDEQTRKQRGWPGDGRALSNALRRLAPNLRAVDINVTFIKRQAGRRPIFIEKVTTWTNQNK
jgi:hypothetical protein